MSDKKNVSIFQVLIVDDDNLVRTLIGSYLEHEGYEVREACSGEEMFSQLEAYNIDLIILDLGLPDEDGIVLTRKVRARSKVPIIILTSRDSQSDLHACLDVGADDYLLKSVNPEEFLLRVRNLLRRSSGRWTTDTLSKSNKSSVIQFDGWKLDTEGYELQSPEGDVVTMTPMEINLLSILAQNTGRVLSRDRLLDGIAGFDDSPSERMIDAFVSRIRKKIEIDSKKPTKIVTVTGVGYKFVG